MWKYLLLAVTVSVGLTGFAPAPMPDIERDKKSEQDRTRLQGMWTVEEFSQGSSPLTGVSPIRLQISRDRWVVTQSGGAMTPYAIEGRVALRAAVVKSSVRYAPETTTGYRAVLDARRGVGAIDLIAEGSKPVVYRGIYRVSGDVLTVCYRETDGAARPTSFEDRGGRTVLLKLRKAGGSTTHAAPSGALPYAQKR